MINLSSGTPLEKILWAAYVNGFGFQPDGEGKALYVSKIGMYAASGDMFDYPDWIGDNEMDKWFMEQTPNGHAPATITDYIGRKFVTIPISEWERIPAILNAILARGDMRLSLHGNYHAQYLPGETFSLATNERKTIEGLIEFCEKCYDGDWRKMNDGCTVKLWVSTKHWNWSTPEGKEFCSMLRRNLLKRPRANEAKAFYKWPGFAAAVPEHKVLTCGTWSHYDPFADSPKPDAPLPVSTRASRDQALQAAKKSRTPSPEPSQLPVSTSAKRALETQDARKKICVDVVEEEEKCMVCLDRAPETMALPCMHAVACKACSATLAKSALNAKKCIKCRAAIASILVEEK